MRDTTRIIDRETRLARHATIPPQSFSNLPKPNHALRLKGPQTSPHDPLHLRHVLVDPGPEVDVDRDRLQGAERGRAEHLVQLGPLERVDAAQEADLERDTADARRVERREERGDPGHGRAVVHGELELQALERRALCEGDGRRQADRYGTRTQK